jgi:hypothetical protein
MVHITRAQLIIQTFTSTGFLDPQWNQTFRDESLSIVDSGDIPEFTGITSFKFGKLTLPGILNGSIQDFGLRYLGGTSNMKRFYPTTFDKLVLMIETDDIILKNYVQYIRNENAYYIFNYFSNVNASVILGNPMMGYKYQTEYVSSGNIIPGETYLVLNDFIYYQNVGIIPGAIFVGVEGDANFSGPGKIKLATQKRKLAWTDEYPADSAMVRDIILQILTKEFQIEKQSILDMINDSANSIELLKSTLTR